MYYKQYFFLLILVAWGLGNSQSLLWYNLSYNDKYFFHKNDINSKSCVWGLNRGQGCEVLKRPKTGLKCKCQRTRRDPRGRKENRNLPICCLLSRYSEERVMGTDFFWRLFGILDILCDTQPVTHTPVLRQTLTDSPQCIFSLWKWGKMFQGWNRKTQSFNGWKSALFFPTRVLTQAIFCIHKIQTIHCK